MTANAGSRLWTVVERIEPNPSDAGIAAFAIDTPRTGSRLPGGGLEINGWVIGKSGPVIAIDTRARDGNECSHQLAVRRPDVARDYPAFPHADRSGFSLWHPLDEAQDAWQVGIVAVSQDGRRHPLATIFGRTERVPIAAPSGHRLVAAPDFVIVGTQRGGTTSLHAWLSAHPRVVTPQTKELHFLTDRHNRGRDWYLGQFPVELPAGALTGEATPYALFHPRAPGRLRDVAPAARLIVLLRNPVERAYSHYLMESARGDEALSFQAALDAEPSRLAGEEERLFADATYVSWPHKHASYVRRGEYAGQLARWFTMFPREQVLILRSEDLYRQPQETLQRVTDYLGLPPTEAGPFSALNRSSGPPLAPGIRDQLARHFAPWNARLADLLGWDPGWD